ncbi:hypothetical protein GGR53DRAFT_532148 [Hypoxylon sp. FL1150]|nr:hypothetical protein GGR53DRAFT_532148 [Hypoxylon sp. FL1150]
MASFVNVLTERSVPTLRLIPESNNQQIVSLAVFTIFSIYISKAIRNSVFGVKAPFVSHRSFYEPAWLVDLRFVWVFKDGMFKVRRNDADILIISNKYVDELRNLPATQISAIRAHLANLLSRYSTTRILLESDLHTEVLQTKLTPDLVVVIPAMKDELDFALKAELAASIKHMENIFTTVMLLRRSPLPLHPLIAPSLPSFWAIRSNLATAKRVIGPMMLERVAAAAEQKEGYQKHSNLL